MKKTRNSNPKKPAKPRRHEYRLRITQPRPYFAELPYYLWGTVNYDSDGNCDSPVGREWTWMILTHRDTGERIELMSSGGVWTISGPNPATARVAYFLQVRSDAEIVKGEPYWQTKSHWQAKPWDQDEAAARAARVAREFENPLLAPFAVGSHFWGSWKHIGWFASSFTWVGRWIMDSVVRNDPRAVSLCIDWLRNDDNLDNESAALRHALEHLTQHSKANNQEWLDWYDSGGGEKLFPKPDLELWLEDLKTIYGSQEQQEA